MKFTHIPVLMNEVMNLMNPQPGEKFVDCTLGGAGHSKEFLKKILPGGFLLGLDQDKNALQAAENNLQEFAGNFLLIHSNFEKLDDVLKKYTPLGVDGIFFDLGVSSPQLDVTERGFSYNNDAPLDMRMNRDDKFTARELINTYSEKDLTDIIFKYGEERWSKRIAQFIVKARVEKEITTTGELVEIIKKAIPKKARIKGPHPAKRTFQAIRIAVNRELEVLEKTLDMAIGWLKPGGRIGVITFHSLEDRIVKEKFKYHSLECICPPEIPICQCDKKAEVKVLTRKPIMAGKSELESNPRSRSAKLRGAIKL